MVLCFTSAGIVDQKRSGCVVASHASLTSGLGPTTNTLTQTTMYKVIHNGAGFKRRMRQAPLATAAVFSLYRVNATGMIVSRYSL